MNTKDCFSVSQCRKPISHCAFTRGIMVSMVATCVLSISAFAEPPYPFRMDNLIPWSIVAFDSQERTPAERVDRIARLGFGQFAFGGNAEQQSTMKDEWRLAKERGMKKDGPKIITIGESNLEKTMTEPLLKRGYKGPFALLGHVKGGDAERVIETNLNGLHAILSSS